MPQSYEKLQYNANFGNRKYLSYGSVYVCEEEAPRRGARARGGLSPGISLRSISGYR